MKKILYHGSNKEFNKFDPLKVGERLTSLGLGHYLTPDRKLASDYGKFIMEFEVDLTNVLDWDNLTKDQRKQIESELLKVVPEYRISHFGEQKLEVLSKNKEGLFRFNELKEKTKNAYNDYAKARIMNDDEIEKYDPELFNSLNIDDVVVGWRETGNLNLANNQQLMTLMNEYHPNLIKELGYTGASFSNQVAIYDSELAKRVVDLKLKKDIKSMLNNKSQLLAHKGTSLKKQR